MPVPLSADEAHQFLHSADAPAAHLDLLNAIGFRAAAAGLRLDVYEALANGPVPGEELARRLDLHPYGLHQLLDALVGFGYLRHDPVAGYANAANTQRWLLRAAPDSYAPVLSFWHTLLTGRWAGLEESVRHGEPAGGFYPWLEERPEALADFHTMLRRLGGWLAEEIVAVVPAPPVSGRLLDLGGGHAAYSVAFCRAHPGLHATVVDLPGALVAGAETTAAAGLADRITLQSGDLSIVDLDAGHDLVLLFNIVHGYGADEVSRLLRRVAAALRPGGRLALLEPLADVPERPPGPEDAFVRAFNLNLFHTQGGRAYAYPELADLLVAAGFTDLTQRVLQRSPTDHLITAVRAG